MGNATNWDGSAWTAAEVDSPYDKTKVFIQDTEPTTGRDGDLLVHPTDSNLMYLDGIWKRIKVATGDVIGLGSLLLDYAGVTHQHNASDINDGTLDVARIPELPASKITSDTLDIARIPDIPASKVNSGTLDIARIPTGTTEGTVALGDHTHTKSQISDFAHEHSADDIVSGTLDEDRIPNIDTSKLTSGTLHSDRLPLATNSETITGNSTTKVITPSNIKAFDSRTFGYETAPNINAYLTTGTFAIGTDATNGPLPSKQGILNVWTLPDAVAQRFQLISDPYTTWTRRYLASSSTWTAWRVTDPAVIHGFMEKTTPGHTSAGTDLPSGTWTQVTGFDSSPIANGVTVNNATGTMTILESGAYDIEFYHRWGNIGTTARFRSGTIVKGTSEPASDASNVIATQGAEASGYLQLTSRKRRTSLTSGDTVSFWVRASFTAHLFNPTVSSIPGWTYAAINRT